MTHAMILKSSRLVALLVLLPLQGHTQIELSPAGPSKPGLAAQAQTSVTGNAKLSAAQMFERLAPSPAQQPLWQAFELRLAHYEAQRLREVPVLASQNSAAQQLTQRIIQQQNRLAALEELELAAKPLLQSLNTAQAALADQYLLGTIGGFSDSCNCRATMPEERRKPQSGSGSQRGRGMGSGL